MDVVLLASNSKVWQQPGVDTKQTAQCVSGAPFSCDQIPGGHQTKLDREDLKHLVADPRATDMKADAQTLAASRSSSRLRFIYLFV